MSGPGPSAIARLLLLWLAGQLLVLNLLAGPATGVDPALPLFARVLAGLGQGDDSWRPMIAAYLESGRSGPAGLYTSVFFDRQIKFQYPPTALLPFPAFEAVGLGPGAWPRALLALSVAWFGALLLALAGIVRAAWPRLAGVDLGTAPRERWLLAACVAIAAPTFYPVAQSLGNGQVQLWITALLALALWAWLRERPVWAGACVGLAALFKPHYGLLLAWGALRGQGRFGAALLGTLGTGLALSVARFGPSSHLGYLDVAGYLARHPDAYWTNQSLAGLLQRGTGQANFQGWFPAYDARIFAASVAFAAALLAAALLVPARDPAAGGTCDLAIMLLSTTLASPIAWRHHYGVALPILAVAIALAIGGPRWRWAGLGAVHLAIGTFFTGLAACAGGPLNVLNSLCLFGGLGLLGLLYALRHGEPPRGGGAA